MDETRAPHISVVVVGQDCQASLARCLQQLALQDFPMPLAEVLVIDNGSARPLTLPERRPPHTALLRQPTQDKCAALNLAISNSSGTVIAFTEAECQLDPAWLSTGHAHLRADPSVGAIVGRVDAVLPTDRSPTPIELHQYAHYLPQQRNMQTCPVGSVTNLMTRRDVLDSVGVFDATLGVAAEREWGQRVAIGRYRVMYADDVRVGVTARRQWTQWWKHLVETRRAELALAESSGEAPQILIPRTADAYVPPVPTIIRTLRTQGSHFTLQQAAQYVVGTIGHHILDTAAAWRVAAPAAYEHHSRPTFIRQHRSRP